MSLSLSLGCRSDAARSSGGRDRTGVMMRELQAGGLRVANRHTHTERETDNREIEARVSQSEGEKRVTRDAAAAREAGLSHFFRTRASRLSCLRENASMLRSFLVTHTPRSERSRRPSVHNLSLPPSIARDLVSLASASREERETDRRRTDAPSDSDPERLGSHGGACQEPQLLSLS